MGTTYDSYQTAELAELAKKNAGVGAAKADQGDSPISVFPSTLAKADMIDVGNSALAAVLVVPTGGTATFDIMGLATGDDDDTQPHTLRHLTDIEAPATTGVLEVVNTKLLHHIGVAITAGTATSVVVSITKYEAGE